VVVEGKGQVRRAFDRALARELKTVLRESKEKAAKMEEPSELWELERFLTQRRQEINRNYDFRYSLPFCHAELRTVKPKLECYPKEINTLGDHLRSRRLDLELLQSDVARVRPVTSSQRWPAGTKELLTPPPAIAYR
jgi:hypothetical protein